VKLDTKELKKITILYVEDDDIVRGQTYAVMSKVFKHTYFAKDGVEGLEVFKAHKDEIDIVVSDINMPNMNGLEMIEHINNIRAQIPTIVTTAHTESKYLMNAMDINIDKYMPKPLQIKELTVNIVNLVQKYRRLINMEALTRKLMEKRQEDESINSTLSEKVERLEAENTYLNAIVDNLVIKFKIDKNGNITEGSNKFLRFFDFSNEEIIGKDISTIRCDNCSQESFQKLMLKAIHTKKTVTAMYGFKKIGDQRTINCDLTMTAFYNQNALVEGYTIYLDPV
jgi:PAS domain S-box-containing protein